MLNEANHCSTSPREPGESRPGKLGLPQPEIYVCAPAPS